MRLKYSSTPALGCVLVDDVDGVFILRLKYSSTPAFVAIGSRVDVDGKFFPLLKYSLTPPLISIGSRVDDILLLIGNSCPSSDGCNFCLTTLPPSSSCPSSDMSNMFLVVDFTASKYLPIGKCFNAIARSISLN